MNKRGFLLLDYLIPLMSLFIGALMGYIFNIWVVIALTIPAVYLIFFYRPKGYFPPVLGLVCIGYCLAATGSWFGALIGYWPTVAPILVTIKEQLVKTVSYLLR
jgi:hypothetical protein